MENYRADEAPRSRKSASLSADQWRKLINIRFGSLRRLAAHRTRLGSLSEEHAGLIRAELTWARIARGDKEDAVLRWLVNTWPLYPLPRLAAMTPEERASARQDQEQFLRSLIRWARSRRGWPRPLTIGNRLAVTQEERTLLKLRTIRYAGQTDTVMQAEQRKRNRERMAAKRLAAGKTPRADSKSKTKPWELEGTSRTTWYRHRSKASAGQEASVGQMCAQYKDISPSYIAHTTVPSHDQPVQDATGQGRGFDPAPTDTVQDTPTEAAAPPTGGHHARPFPYHHPTTRRPHSLTAATARGTSCAEGGGGAAAQYLASFWRA